MKIQVNHVISLFSLVIFFLQVFANNSPKVVFALPLRNVFFSWQKSWQKSSKLGLVRISILGDFLILDDFYF